MNEEKVLSKEQEALKGIFEYIEEVAESSDVEKIRKAEKKYPEIIKNMYDLTNELHDPELEIIANTYSCVLIFKTLGKDPWNLLKEARKRLDSYRWGKRYPSINQNDSGGVFRVG